MLRSVIRDMTAEEVSEAVEGALAAVSRTKGDVQYMSDVIRVTVIYCLTKNAVNPFEVDGIDYKNKRIKSVIIAVSNWLRYDYDGVAEFGLWERTRSLLDIAQGK